MHAWDAGTREQYPGWYRAVEYIPRAQEIARTVFPRLLAGVRASRLRLFHVVGGGDYYKACPGYKRAVALAGPEPPALEQVEPDPVLERLRDFRAERVFVGAHNKADVERGFASLDFQPEARRGELPPALRALQGCRRQPSHLRGVRHQLVPAAFPRRHGRYEQARPDVLRPAPGGDGRGEQGDRAFGFVFDVDDFVNALQEADG